MFKIWRKPLHKRKIWKKLSLIKKITYYIQPFVENFVELWLLPLPFPTILKLLSSGVLLLFLIVPVLYPFVLLIGYYSIVQYFIESDLNIQFPNNFDILHHLETIFNFQIPNEHCEQFIISHLEKCRYVITAIASCVDYMRLALTLVSG